MPARIVPWRAETPSGRIVVGRTVLAVLADEVIVALRTVGAFEVGRAVGAAAAGVGAPRNASVAVGGLEVGVAERAVGLLAIPPARDAVGVGISVLGETDAVAETVAGEVTSGVVPRDALPIADAVWVVVRYAGVAVCARKIRIAEVAVWLLAIPPARDAVGVGISVFGETDAVSETVAGEVTSGVVPRDALPVADAVWVVVRYAGVAVCARKIRIAGDAVWLLEVPQAIQAVYIVHVRVARKADSLSRYGIAGVVAIFVVHGNTEDITAPFWVVIRCAILAFCPGEPSLAHVTVWPHEIPQTSGLSEIVTDPLPVHFHALPAAERAKHVCRTL